MADRGLIRAHPDFRRLWVGDGLSQIGSSVTVLAIPLLAATILDASAWEVGLLASCATLPHLLVGLPAGAWVDRLRRRPLLIMADLGRAALLAWVPVAALSGVLTIGQLYAVELLVGTGTVLFDVSRGSYLPSLVGRTRLVEANGKIAANRAVGYSAGPTVAGQLVQWIGAPLSVVAAVAGYLWSAAWVASIRTREPRPPCPEERSLLREIREGMRFVVGQPFIRATTLHATTTVLCLATRYAVEVLFLLRTVGLSPAAIGLLVTVAGLGAVTGALVGARLARAVGRVRAVLVTGLAMGPFNLLIPITGPGPWLACFAVGAGLSGFCIVAGNVVSVSLRQELCPDRLLGRMNASTQFLAWASLPLGGLVGGALGTAIGLRATLWLAAAGMVLSSLWLILSPICRSRDLPEPRRRRPHQDVRAPGR